MEYCVSALETEHLILRVGDGGWEIIPKALGEPVGMVEILDSQTKGFIGIDVVFDEDWRYVSVSETLLGIVRYFFEKTDIHTIQVRNADIEKELLSCGFRPQMRGCSDCGFSINKYKAGRFEKNNAVLS